MPVKIVMPKLGLTMTEGLIVKWCKKQGAPVRKGEIVFILETEKVIYEVESPEAGVLVKILVPEGETVPVGTVVGYLGQAGEDDADLPAGPPAAEPPAEAPGQAAAGNLAGKTDPDAGMPPKKGRIKVSPLARKIARAGNIDLAAVAGTGPGGRILRADVEAFKAGAPAAEIPIPPGKAAGDRLVPFSGMRRAIAGKMLSSKVKTAQTYMSVSVDATGVKACRETLLPHIQKERGVRVTITDIMMKIAGDAIQRHPVINTRWTDEGIVYLAGVHMGMAMGLEEGLIVPVIRDINKKGFGQIAADRTELIAKGKENRLLPDDISGSTFTLSTLGMFGIEQFTSNINLPESAILAVGAIIDKPIVVDGAVVIRPMMTVTLSYDHRIIDGAEAGKFMRTFKSFCENPIQVFA